MLRVVADAISTPVNESMLVRRYEAASSIAVAPLPLREVVAMCTRDADTSARLREVA
jgi:hypothetical protein